MENKIAKIDKLEQAEDMFYIFHLLEEHRDISPGSYDKLKECLRGNNECLDIINSFEYKMRLALQCDQEEVGLNSTSDQYTGDNQATNVQHSLEGIEQKPTETNSIQHTVNNTEQRLTEIHDRLTTADNSRKCAQQRLTETVNKGATYMQNALDDTEQRLAEIMHDTVTSMQRMVAGVEERLPQTTGDLLKTTMTGFLDKFERVSKIDDRKQSYIIDFERKHLKFDSGKMFELEENKHNLGYKVIKCGITSHLTSGALAFSDTRPQAQVKVTTDTCRVWRFILKGQLVVDRMNREFFISGDSGSAVFVKTDNTFECLGIAIGGMTSSPQTLVTPIKHLLNALTEQPDGARPLSVYKLKSFV